MPAPGHLGASEKAVWDAVVRAKPADWITADAAPVLVDYCRAVVMGDELARLMAKADGDPTTWVKLAREARDCAKLVAHLAVKMRITNQSRWQPAVAANRAKPLAQGGGSRPWEFKG